MNALNVLDTFQFDDKLVLDEDVNSVSTIEPNILVSYRSTQLELKGDSVATQLMGHALFVRRFEQSRAEVTVDFDGTTDDTFESSSNSLFVLFVVTASRTHASEWRTTKVTRLRPTNVDFRSRAARGSG